MNLTAAITIAMLCGISGVIAALIGCLGALVIHLRWWWCGPRSPRKEYNK